jgi:hypothetical protein
MILFPKLITKICLILLCGLITFHIAFVNSERYNAYASVYQSQRAEYSVKNVPENIYKFYLEDYAGDQFHSKIGDQFIANTKKTYIFGLPENTKNYIYFGYFIVVSTLIFYAKFEKNEK